MDLLMRKQIGKRRISDNTAQVKTRHHKLL